MAIRAKLTYFAIPAAQHGMPWCSLDLPGSHDPHGRNRLGSQLGLASQPVDGVLPSSDLATAHYLGRRLANVTRAFKDSALRPDRRPL